MDIVPTVFIVIGVLALTTSVLFDTTLRVGHWCRHLMPALTRRPRDG